MIGLWRHAQQMFQMILLSVNKTFQNMFVWKISNESFIVNQHLKSITKPTFELQLHVALQQDILSESTFVKKNIAMSIIFHMAPCEPV